MLEMTNCSSLCLKRSLCAPLMVTILNKWLTDSACWLFL